MKRRGVVISAAAVVSAAGCIGLEQLDSGDRLDAKGTIDVTIDGSPVDLTDERFQAENAEDSSLAFHFHDSDEHWYMEGREPVSLAEAIDLIPHFEYANEGGEHVITYETVYDGSEPETTIAFRANGEPVEPTEYELEDGDHLEVEITTDG